MLLSSLKYIFWYNYFFFKCVVFFIMSIILVVSANYYRQIYHTFSNDLDFRLIFFSTMKLVYEPQSIIILLIYYVIIDLAVNNDDIYDMIGIILIWTTHTCYYNYNN